MAAKLCPNCGATKIPGRCAVHLSGECMSARYRRASSKHRRRPAAKHRRRPGRPADEDLTPEQIERIMARRAREQRWERNREGV